MNKFQVGDLVIDNNEECNPREVVLYFCKHCNKKILGLLGTTDGVIIPLSDDLYKKFPI